MLSLNLNSNTLITVFLIIIAIANFLLGFLIYKKSRRNEIRYYVFTSYAVALWTLGIACFVTDLLPIPDNLLVQVINVVGGFIPLLFTLFALNFLDDQNDSSRKIWRSAIIFPGMLIIALIFIPGLFVETVTISNGIRTIVFGPLFAYYAAMNSLYFTGSFIILLRRYLKAENIARLQLKTVLTGTLASSFIGVITNIFLPLAGNFKYVWLGPIGTSIMIAFTTYSIAKFKLFNIRLILTEIATTLVFIGLLGQLAIAKDDTQRFVALIFIAIIGYGGYLFIKAVNKVIAKEQELNKANHQLEQDKKELVELDRMKDEFLQMATHELNTPITVIKGKLDMAIREDMCKLNGEQKKFFEPILTDTQRLSNLSDDILNVARIDQHRLKIRPDETDLDEFVSQIVSGFDIKAKERGNSLAYIKLSKSLPKLMVDQSKIGEVITNLVNNANKFTENGKIVVASKLKDDSVVISVADTGVGIEQEDQKHLFEKFYQAARFDPENPQEQQGSGLGLYISKNIIELHGGKIWLESEKGKGSTFYFSLPLEYKVVEQPKKMHIADDKLRML